jgi:deoxyguanosine kinase
MSVQQDKPGLTGINPGYLVVEGPIGVGKTSLAQKLSQAFGSDLLLERPEENPFLERFYQSPKQFSLPTQLFFLFQRARQMQEWKQRDLFAPTRVADFLLEKDRLFARLNLDDDELRLYEQVYEQLKIDLPVPDLVICLQAPVEE